MANLGPLKNHLEHIEFQLNEKKEEFHALNQEFAEYKIEARDRKKENENLTNELEMKDQMQNSLHNINLAMEERLAAQAASCTSM